MTDENKKLEDTTINIDQIDQCRSFDELRQSALFRQFMRIFYRKHPELFSLEKAGEVLSEEVLVDFFATHPSIWNEAEKFWKNDIRKEGNSLDSFQLAQNISNHIRELIAHALQQGGLHLAEGEDASKIFDFDSQKNRPNRAWQPEFSNPDDVVGNGIAEMGFDLSPAIQAARIPREGDEGYTEVPDELYEATKKWLEKTHNGWEVHNKDIIYMRDSLTAVQEAVKAFTGTRITGTFRKKEERGNVVTCTPTYGGLLHHPKKVFGTDTKTIPLINSGEQLIIDTNALQITLQKGDVFILCNPQNPGGHVYSRSELLEIKKICKQKEVKIIIDELHDGLVFDDNFVSMGSLYEGEENPTATLLSTGKSFNLSDQPCHMMVIPDKDMRQAFNRNRIQALTPTAIPNRAAIAAFEQSDEWRIELLHYLHGNADYLYDRIKAMPGLKMVKPQATYLAWIDAREAGLEEAIKKEFTEDDPTQRGPADYFEKVANVAVLNGSNFDTSGASNMFFRLNFAVPRSELREMLDRIERALPKGRRGA
ncbi:MAG: aminotransferase class I/II-fold pyridoxal phosphate-dependent enzyme [bacterium]|nr:aminotransferase class I/II-fold pyridoxal phosphate-dependent enzyme [bacterium]